MTNLLVCIGATPLEGNSAGPIGISNLLIFKQKRRRNRQRRRLIGKVEDGGRREARLGGTGCGRNRKDAKALIATMEEMSVGRQSGKSRR